MTSLVLVKISRSVKQANDEGMDAEETKPGRGSWCGMELVPGCPCNRCAFLALVPGQHRILT
jgi:hypothetical protein